MWKSLSIILLGLASGLFAHLGYFNAFEPKGSTLALHSELEWLRDELDLSADQYAQISEIHDESAEDLKLLTRKVRELQLLLAELETERVREGYVDFLEMRSYLEVKRKLDEACEKSTSDLIASVGTLMDVEQRKRYLSIVQSKEN